MDCDVCKRCSARNCALCCAEPLNLALWYITFDEGNLVGGNKSPRKQRGYQIGKGQIRSGNGYIRLTGFSPLSRA
jgi:hypothetical protein